MDEDGVTIFIYDDGMTLDLDKEDDPADAISYFHPATVSHDQRVWLCGSLVTIIRSLERLTGSFPDFAELDNFKFSFLKSCGYIIGLGASADRFSSASVTNMCLNVLDGILFYYSSVDSLNAKLKSQNEDAANKLERLIETMVHEHWEKAEINVSLCCNNKEITRPVTLKCASILNFCCCHNGVLSSCLIFQARMLLSLMGQTLTKLCTIASSCQALGSKVKIIDGHTCRFIPVYVSDDDYDKLVRMQLQRYGESNWKARAETSDCGVHRNSGGKKSRQPSTSSPEEKSAKSFPRNKSLEVVKQMNHLSSTEILRESTVSEVHSAGSIYDTASCASDSHPPESSSDNDASFKKEMRQKTDGRTEFNSVCLTDSSPSAREDGYATAQSDLCQFLAEGRFFAGNPKMQRQKDNLPSPKEQRKSDNDTRKIDISLTHCTQESNTEVDAESSLDSIAAADTKELCLFTCCYGDLTLILLINKHDGKRMTQEIMRGCREEFTDISQQLSDQTLEIPKTPKMKRPHSVRFSATSGHMLEYLTADEREGFQESVTEFQNMLSRHPGLCRVSSVSPGSAFQADHTLNQKSYFYSNVQ